MTTIAVHTHPAGLLAVVMPLGIAAARPTSLVVDLDPAGVPLPGTRTLRDLVRHSPSLDELRPRRQGTACLPNGGIPFDEAEDVVRALMEGWPDTVLRVGAEVSPYGSSGVGVRPILPGLRPPVEFLPVFQPTGMAPIPADLRGLILPRLPGRVARSLLAGTVPRGRWLQAVDEVWARAPGWCP